MNKQDKFRPSGEARLRYLDCEFQVELPGQFVRCAVTDNKIPLGELKYWSVSRQEAYIDSASAFSRFMQRGQRA